MKIPHSFFYKFLKENKERCFFIINETIYIPKFLPNGERIFFVCDKKFGLDEGLKLSKLEELYFSNNDEELKKHGEEYLKRTLSDKETINEDYHKLGINLEFLEFFLYDLLKKKKIKNSEIKILTVKKEDFSLIEKLFSYDCFVRKNIFYSLNKDKKNLFYVKVNNYAYNIGENLRLDLEEFERRYLKGIEEKIYDQLTKGQKSLFYKIKGLKEKKELINFLKKKEFFDNQKNIGFKKGDKGFFITAKAPKPKEDKKQNYILYEPYNKKYYRFEEALIGVKLVKRNGKIEWQSPIVINPYVHPSLPSKKPLAYQKICEGEVNYKKLVEGKDLESTIKCLLAEGERLILSGYFGIHGAYSDLTAKHFQNLEVKDFNPREVTNEYTK